MKNIAWAILGLFLLASVSYGVVVNKRDSYVNFGDSETGTSLNMIECHNLSFAGDTSTTASSNIGTDYYIVDGWKTTSADHGKVTVAISGGTLTATTATATTGTLSVVVIGVP